MTVRGIVIVIALVVASGCAGSAQDSPTPPIATARAEASPVRAATATTAAPVTPAPTTATSSPRTLAPTLAPAPARVAVTSQTTFCSPGRTTGMVRNDGGSTARVVSVSGRIFLSDGRLWTTGEAPTSPGNVEPGRTAAFELYYSNPQVCLGGVRGELLVTWTGGSTPAVPLKTD